LLPKSILITRPQGQQQDMVQALTDAGWHCLHQPLLRILPIDEQHPQFHDMKNKVMNIDQYDIIITVTSNASTLAFDWIDQYWPQLPVGIHWFAVGHGSAVPLMPLGMLFTLPDSHHSEGLLALPELKDVTGKKVLILRGKGGREHLANSLTERGAQVSYCEFYERAPENVDKAQFSRLLSQQQIHYALVTSGEMAQQLTECVDGPLLSSIHLLVPSERIHKLLQQNGQAQQFAAIHVCPSLKLDNLIPQLEDIYQATATE